MSSYQNESPLQAHSCHCRISGSHAAGRKRLSQLGYWAIIDSSSPVNQLLVRGDTVAAAARGSTGGEIWKTCSRKM